MTKLALTDAVYVASVAIRHATLMTYDVAKVDHEHAVDADSR